MLLPTLVQIQKGSSQPSDPHWVLAGSYLHDVLPADLAVIAEGSWLNKVFASKKDYLTKLKFGLQQWTKRNGLPSLPSQDISWGNASGNNTLKRSPATSPSHPSLPSNNCLKALSSTAKTNKLRRFGSTARSSTIKRLKTPYGSIYLRTGPTRSTHNCQLPCRTVDQQVWKVLSLGCRQRASTSRRPGQKEKFLPKWSTKHILR